jgi:hypothetical protein
MANTPLGAFVYDTSLPFIQTRPALAHSTSANQAGNVLVANSFVKVSAGILIANAASDTSTYGFTPDVSHISTDEPYTAPNGVVNSPIDVLNTEFVINSSSVSATSNSTAVLGSTYGLALASGIPILDLANTATASAFFVAGKLFPGDATTDINHRYVCRVIATARQ